MVIVLNNRIYIEYINNRIHSLTIDNINAGLRLLKIKDIESREYATIYKEYQCREETICELKKALDEFVRLSNRRKNRNGILK